MHVYGDERQKAVPDAWQGRRDRALRPSCAMSCSQQARDLLDEPDDSATQLWVFDTYERLHQIQALGCGEEALTKEGEGTSADA